MCFTAGTADQLVDLSTTDRSAVLEQVMSKARDAAVSAGALSESVKVSILPLNTAGLKKHRKFKANFFCSM